VELDPRGRRLRVALAEVLVRDNAPELRLMHEWLDNWSGLGLVVAGMTHQGWDVQLTTDAARDWRPTFFRSASRTPSSLGRMGAVEVGRSKTLFRMLVAIRFDGAGRPPRVLWLEASPAPGRIDRDGLAAVYSGRPQPGSRALTVVPEPGGQADGD
jgi:hypothetical protein